MSRLLGWRLGQMPRTLCGDGREATEQGIDQAAVLQAPDSAGAGALKEALRKSGGKIYGAGGAAELLGMRPTTLMSKIAALGIKRH